MLIFVGGHIGAGKSTIARGFAEAISCPYYDIDEVKKVVFREDPDFERNMREGIPFSDETRLKVYDRVIEDLKSLRSDSEHVVVDETLHKRQPRHRLYEAAREIFDDFVIIWVKADEKVVLDRLNSKKREGHILNDPVPMHEAFRREFEEFNRSVIVCSNNGTPEDGIRLLKNLIGNTAKLATMLNEEAPVGGGAMIGTTITQHLIEEQRRIPGATGDLTSVINDVVTACKAIASALRYGRLAGEDVLGVSSATNVQGETQKTLDILANDLFVQRTELGGHVAALVSEEMENIRHLRSSGQKGRYLLLCDPVDGSSNIAENASIGTVFSILKRPEGAEGPPDEREFLQVGTRQVCAGYAIYGPSTMIVMTTGKGVNGFTLDPRIGEFVLSHPSMRLPVHCPRFFINLADRRFWDEALKRYVAECLSGSGQPGASIYDYRWSGGVVADVHRILVAGGIYLSPGIGRKDGQENIGKLRLLYEVNPLSFLIEQAGGRASDGTRRAMEIEPASLHQRSLVYFGSRGEVDRFLEACSGDRSMIA